MQVYICIFIDDQDITPGGHAGGVDSKRSQPTCKTNTKNKKTKQEPPESRKSKQMVGGGISGCPTVVTNYPLLLVYVHSRVQHAETSADEA